MYLIDEIFSNISSIVHVNKRSQPYMNYNISPKLTSTKLSLGTKNNITSTYKSAKTHGYLLNSKFFWKLCLTKMCIIRGVTCNIHKQQIIILAKFQVLTMIDLSRIKFLIHQNYSQISGVQVKLCEKKPFLRKMSFLELVY